VTLQSFDWRTLRIARRTEPALIASFLTSQQPGEAALGDPQAAWTAGLRLRDYGSVAQLVHAAAKDGRCAVPEGTLWSPDMRDLSADAIVEAHALGLTVVPWTVNERADMRRMIDWCVDGLITDYPDVAREVMRGKGLALPPPVRAP
jgi:glycerophosphoryl diester phosphodiesterase